MSRIRSALALAGVIVWSVVMVALVPSTAWSTETMPPDPEPTSEPSEPVDPEPTSEPTEPVATETVTVIEQAEPVEQPDAPGVGTGVYVDPSTGSVRVSEPVGVALGVAAWLAALVAGLGTAWMVLP